MVRRAERPGGDDRLAAEGAHDAVDLGGFQSLGQCQIGKNGRQPFGQHGFAGTGRTDENDVVTAGGGDFEGAFDMLLAFDIVEVGVVLRVLTEQIVEIGAGGA